MLRLLTAYALTAVLFVGLDGVYLATIGGKLFKATLGDVLAPSITVPPAILFYLLFPVGLMIFAVQPALAEGRWLVALQNGALLGFFAYATYDLTNFATIRNWAVSITAVDLVWGTVLSGVASAAACAITRLLFGPA